MVLMQIELNGLVFGCDIILKIFKVRYKPNASPRHGYEH